MKRMIRYGVGHLCYDVYLYFGLVANILHILINSLGSQGRWLEKQDILASKQSDTLFILGSGKSINQFSQSQWSDIGEGDALGFNFWILHDFVPTFYMFEYPRDYENQDKIIRNMVLRSNDYKKTLLILKEASLGKKRFRLIPDAVKENARAVFSPTAPAFKLYHLEKAMKLQANLLKWFRKKDKGMAPVFNKRASLYAAIQFGYISGYKNIVLCGIDLNTMGYFYEEDRQSYEQKGLYVPDSGQTKDTHITNDPAYGEVTVSSLVVSLNEKLLKPEGVRLYTGSQNSALVEQIPYYWDSNHVNEGDNHA